MKLKLPIALLSIAAGYLVMGYTSTKHPSTQLLHDQVYAVRVLDEGMLTLPFFVPNAGESVQERVIESPTYNKRWEMHFDEHHRLIKNHSNTASNKRYEYDDDGGFEEYTNDDLSARCSVNTYSLSTLSYTCDKGDIQGIRYDHQTGVVTVDGIRTQVMYDEKYQVRHQITLDEQLRTTHIHTEKLKAIAAEFSAERPPEYSYPDSEIIDYRYADDGITVTTDKEQFTFKKKRDGDVLRFSFGSEAFHTVVTDIQR